VAPPGATSRKIAKRLEGKVAIIIGAAQSPGEGIGNGRATAIRFAQEGAKILTLRIWLPE